MITFHSIALTSVLAMARAYNEDAACNPISPDTCTPAVPYEVTSYSMYNGGSGGVIFQDLKYPTCGPKVDYVSLSGGTGDLTDGTIATNSWDAGQADTEKYVGWYFRYIDPPYPLKDTNEVPITFFFNQEVTIASLKISVDEANGGVHAPATVVIERLGTCEGTVYPFPVNPGGVQTGPYTAEIWLDTPVTVDMATGLSVTLTRNTNPTFPDPDGNSWIFVSEIQFFGDCSPTLGMY